MKDVELYAKGRHAVRIEGLSRRAVGIDPRTVGKMLEFSVPPAFLRGVGFVLLSELATRGNCE